MKMLMIFRRFSEYLILEIDRKDKKVNLTGKQTNYKQEQCAWRMLWDKCEYHKKNFKEDNLQCKDCDQVSITQNKQTESLLDKDFVKVFDDQMKVYGFNMVRWET